MIRTLPVSLRVAALLVILGSSPAAAQPMAGYYEQYEELVAPPSAFQEGLLGTANPALPAVTGTDYMALWSTRPGDLVSVAGWGLFSSSRFGPIALASSLRRQKQGGRATTSYTTGLAGGGPGGAVGIGYQRFWGEATALGRYDRLRTGAIWRPNPHLSIGMIGHFSLETGDREGVVTAGVRPLGSSRLTFFADAALGEGQAVEEASWSAGAAAEPARGISLVGRYFKGGRVSFGLSLDLGRVGLKSQARVGASGSPGGTTHRVRHGEPRASVLSGPAKEGEGHLALQLEGGIPYRQSSLPGPIPGFFGEEKRRFYEVVRALGRAADTEQIQTVALNLSGLQIGPEKAWELRSALRSVQEQGKTVVVYLENGGMSTYHLASVADRLVLDPEGTLRLPGYARSRTYLKGTLEKLGLGFQAWRFFEYKSAAEPLSRRSMSRADSLQRQAYVDDQYALMREDAAASRPLDTDSLGQLIDQKFVLTAQEARDAGLVDTLARWTHVEEFLKDVTDRDTDGVSPGELEALATAPRAWGAPPEIALVYGLGATATGSGLKARELSETFRELKKDNQVEAVVFRVDSPGGAPLAADLVAEALKKCAEEKPVIVSQGQVAASGGYLISAHADSIVAGPNTVTGSIGVIGGWLYDEGFSGKTGLSSDAVSRGERAELFGERIAVPLLGTVPTRKLTEEELARIEEIFGQLYDHFVKKVAAGRDTTETHVRSVAEGRIWSGKDGRRQGLVDRIGGLATALSIAREAAGLTGERVRVREVNQSKKRELGGPLPMAMIDSWLGGSEAPSGPASNSPTVAFVRFLSERQPGPLLLLPPGAYPASPAETSPLLR